MAELPIAPVKRLLKNAGAARISDSAAEELAAVLEAYGEEISEAANRLAKQLQNVKLLKQKISN